MNTNINKNHLGKVFFAISLLIFVLMIFTPLNQLIIHKDEYFTLAVIKFSVMDLIKINVNDVHPPLYYLILKIITKILTALNISYNTLFVLKITSIIPYGLILLFSATKFKEEYGWLTAGIFALSLSCLSQFFMHFIIARMYSFSLLFLLISFYYYKNILKGSDKKSWILFTIFSVLAAYTHYFAAISAFVMYLMLLIFLLKSTERRNQIKCFAISVAASVILYSPWILTLLNQINRVHKYFWIPDLTLSDFINCLGYFATANKSLGLEIIAILSLIFFIAILFKQYNSFEKNENYLILSGICIFIGTLLIGSILSVVYKPILIARYLIPSSAVLWFSISILVGKIKNNRILIISIVLIILLCVSGINDMINYNDYLLKTATYNDKILNDVNDNADIIIINSGMGVMEFGDYLNDVDIYTIEFGGIYGVDNKNVHEIYNFTELNSTQIDNLINNNTDKSVYILDAEGFEKFNQYNKTKIGVVGGNSQFYELQSKSIV